MLLILTTLINLCAILVLGELAQRKQPFFVFALIKNVAARRAAESEVPRLLDALAQAVRAGLNTEAALRRVSQQSGWKGEGQIFLRNVLVGLNAGKSVADALSEGLKVLRWNSSGMRLRQSFVALAAMQRTGGNIVRLLSDGAESARNAIFLKRKAKALSAQMKLQAVVISVAPSAVAGILFVVSPESLEVFWTDGLGVAMLCGLVFFNALGVFFLIRIALSWSR